MDILSSPFLYNLLQFTVGAMSARKIVINNYSTIKSKYKVLDIGCGTGYIVKYLPDDISYIGIDVNKKYIDYAKNKYSNKYSFICEYITTESILKYGSFDMIMMNGLIHHLDDSEVINILSVAKSTLKDTGSIVGIDGCYKNNQDIISLWMLDNDRGKFVRNRIEYELLYKKVFNNIFMELRNDISYFPYSYLIWKLSNNPTNNVY